MTNDSGEIRLRVSFFVDQTRDAAFLRVLRSKSPNSRRIWIKKILAMGLVSVFGRKNPPKLLSCRGRRINKVSLNLTLPDFPELARVISEREQAPALMREILLSGFRTEQKLSVKEGNKEENPGKSPLPVSAKKTSPGNAAKDPLPPADADTVVDLGRLEIFRGLM